jgi:Fe-S-cluster-containing hydrogenase component 2
MRCESGYLPRLQTLLKSRLPALHLHNGKAEIDRNLCVGCRVCAQVCSFGAITREGADNQKGE